MSDTVIKVENLSKSYTIRHQSGERYSALRDVLTNGVKNVARPKGTRVWRGSPLGAGSRSQPATPHPPPTTEEFWALNDVSFEVKQGAPIGGCPLGAVGIPSARLRTSIGRNGAGKSTLTSTSSVQGSRV